MITRSVKAQSGGINGVFPMAKYVLTAVAVTLALTFSAITNLQAAELQVLAGGATRYDTGLRQMQTNCPYGEQLGKTRRPYLAAPTLPEHQENAHAI
jgi:hypothetical protein